MPGRARRCKRRAATTEVHTALSGMQELCVFLVPGQLKTTLAQLSMPAQHMGPPSRTTDPTSHRSSHQLGTTSEKGRETALQAEEIQ